MKRKRPDDENLARQGPLQPIWQAALDVFETILRKGYPCRAFVLIGPFGDAAKLLEPRVNAIVEGKETALKNIKEKYRKPFDTFEGFKLISTGEKAYLSMNDMQHFLRGDLHVVSEDDTFANVTYCSGGDASIRLDGKGIQEIASNLPMYVGQPGKRPQFTLSERFQYQLAAKPTDKLA